MSRAPRVSAANRAGADAAHPPRSHRDEGATSVEAGATEPTPAPQVEPAESSETVPSAGPAAQRARSRKLVNVVIRDQYAHGCTARGKGKRWLGMAWDSQLRRYKSKAFHEEGEAKRWAADTAAGFLKRMDSAADIPWVTVGEEYVEQLRSSRRSERHVAEIDRVVHALHEAGARDLKSPNFRLVVQRWLAAGKSFAKERKNTPTVEPITRNRWLQHIRAVVNHAMETRLLFQNPIRGIKDMPIAKKQKAIFTVDELRTLLHPKHESHPYFLRFALLAYTGCRLREGINLCWEDIDWESRQIHVKREVKRNLHRYVPLMDELHAILHARKPEKASGFIIQTDRNINHKSHWLHFMRYLKSCGVVPGERSPHSTRHTWISLMSAMDTSAFVVSTYAGHRSIETTQGYFQTSMALRLSVKDWSKGQFCLRPTPASNKKPIRLTTKKAQ